ncbi:MAG: DEAD/DEAH box helicase [Candidatus Lokiarchaeota archaeon]|nr:DEAD/DEAH box helicase [Candidatus Lokiarchaeota archaeon]
MKLKPDLQLTYIPSEYWNSEASKFTILSKKINIPKKSSFFILWINNSSLEGNLAMEISQSFPEIPIDTLVSCKINLAFLVGDFFEIREITAKVLPLIPAARYLNKLEIFEGNNRNKLFVHFTDSVKTWALLTKLVFEILNRGNFIPHFEKEGDDKFRSKWQIILKSELDNERFNYILSNSSWQAFNLPASFKNLKKPSKNRENQYTDELWHNSYIFSHYFKNVGDLLIRYILKSIKFQTFEEFYNLDIIKEKNRESNLSWDYKFLKSLIKRQNSFNIVKLHESIIPKLINNWTNSIQISTAKYGIRLTIKLEYPQKNKEDWVLKFYISTEDTMDLISLKDFWIGKKIASKVLDRIQNKEELIESILKSLYLATVIYPPIKKALNNSFPEDILVNSNEVMNFLSFPKELLIQSGYHIILPDVFNIGGRQKLSTKIIITTQKEKEKISNSNVLNPIFQIDDILNYKWQIELGNDTLEKDEIKDIIDSNQPLINWKGDWILVEQQDINNLKKILNPSNSSGGFNELEGNINYVDALKLGLSGEAQLEEGGTNYDVLIEGQFDEIVNRIKSLKNFTKINPPKSFQGKLRSYQKDGLTWLVNMSELNFGLCLADDMGLGKTIQIIALLLYFKENYPKDFGSTLIICPTSVLYNWKHELNKFAPNLDVILHHGTNRVKNILEFTKNLFPHSIILTSFATIRNDINLLKTIPFTGIIVDESQNMKNYSTQQTKAIYQLQSQYKVCLSGTPIENRLIELWTLFEFLNPGLLGDRKEFQEDIIIPIERYSDKNAISKLKKIIAPFILRRLKIDKSIIQDLPEKNEMKIYTDLSKIQLFLYKSIVKEALAQINDNASNKKNKNIFILGLLTKFKQICNHPYQYLKKSLKTNLSKKEFEEIISQSHKLERLLEKLDNVINNNEKSIIFTQFTQMGDLLEQILTFKYQFPILYFHGSISAENRKKIIEEFQSDDVNSSPILILSLKAGGTGLNLTKATTIFHYDRWWNPAVEKQATDRAYRIGQTKNVNVYKFITIGTIEEKIDELIEEKKELANSIITSGESWLSQLDNDKIKELISLNL